MKVLIADKYEDQGLDGLKALGCEVIYTPDLTAEQLPTAIADTDPTVLIVRSTKVQDPAIEAAQSLKVIIRAGAGYDTIQTATARAKGISVCNCPGTNSAAVAELTFGLMLAHDRRIPDQTADLRQGVWDKKKYSKMGRGLKGRTLGLIGVGQIGILVARRAVAFDMQVLYHKRTPCEELDNNPNAQRVSLEQLLAESDFVSLHVPSNDSTKHLINAQTLAQMKNDAVLINTTRGAVVDQAALAEALTAGTIGGAALDVYENEPAAGDTAIANEVVAIPAFLGTHHVGASTEQAQLAVAAMTVDIVTAFKNDGTVLNCVN
ncbi:MAG: phosphoglycerate dehydrogenase [Planctomycetes bacterium]|nr:phosphoglycerate dehydrogenase [Planctomycetota bacterium]NOG54665.1 hydroxyacid dehydrogenase [Planctomycetota bacterium]